LEDNLISSYVETEDYEITMKDEQVYKVPRIEVSATRNEDKVALVIINRSSHNREICDLHFMWGEIADQVQHWSLVGDSPKSYNDRQRPDRVSIKELKDTVNLVDKQTLKLEIPAHSVNVLKIDI
ncbi:MAG: hypothetical protein ACOCZ3_03300, partial [Bacillota bacterium]